MLINILLYFLYFLSFKGSHNTYKYYILHTEGTRANLRLFYPTGYAQKQFSEQFRFSSEILQTSSS